MDEPVLLRVLGVAFNVWPASDLAPAAATCAAAYSVALTHPQGILPLGGKKGNRVHYAIQTRKFKRLEELLELSR